MVFKSVDVELPRSNTEIFVIRRVEVYGHMVNKVGTMYVGSRPCDILTTDVIFWCDINFPDGLPPIVKISDVE